MKRQLAALLALVLATLAAAPVAAHEGHGQPGLMHGFSDEHGLALLAAIVILALTVLFRAPLTRMGARLSAPLVRQIARYRSRK
jgi:hypothetical protein